MRGFAALIAALLSISACASTGGTQMGGDNYAAMSPLGAGLSRADAGALASAFRQAMDAGALGERFDWKGPGAFGWIKARETRLGNLKADPEDRPAMPAGLRLDELFETERGLYALTRNANARLGPSTDQPILEQLISGTGVTVIGKVVGKPWMLVEADGRVRGYIHESLMIKAPGTELELAGGPRKAAAFCRDFEQRLSSGGQSDMFEGVACREDGRWVLKAPPPEAPVKLF